MDWQDRDAADRGQRMLRHKSMYMTYVNYKGMERFKQAEYDACMERFRRVNTASL